MRWIIPAVAAAALAAATAAYAEPSPEPEPKVAITRVNYNAVGADTFANRWQEAIYLRNVGETTVDMSGWKVHDAYRNAEGEWGNVFTFPEGVKVKPGKLVVVTPAAGTNRTNPDETQVYYWDFRRGYNGHFLNNQGDTVYVRNKDGNLVTKFSYSFDNGYYVR